MKKTLLLTAAHLRKGKGQAASFFLIILIAALLMNLGLVTWLNYEKNFDRRAGELNSADAMIVLQDTHPGLAEELEREMRADSRTLDLETRRVLLAAGSCIFNTGETARYFALLNSEEESRIGKISYVERGEENADTVILPYLFNTGGGYEIGDRFVLTISAPGREEQKYTYTVAGFYEETMLATINTTTTGILLSGEGWRKLSEEYGGGLDAAMLMARLNDSAEEEQYITKFLAQIPQDVMKDSSFYQIIKQARTLTSSIGSMLVVAFAIIIVVVSLIIVAFRIGNSIEEDMRNIGALKAIGYTSGQIIRSILLQFLSVGAVGGIAGLALSYLVLPFLSQMFAVQTGVIWEQGFDLPAALITMLAILAAVTAVSLLSARKVKKLHPIVALRSGIQTHTFKHNFLPLDRTRGGVLPLLAGKQFLQNGKRNVMVGLIIAGVSFTSVFAGTLYYNISLESDNFMSLSAGERPNVQFTASGPEDTEALMRDLSELPQVRKVCSTYNDYLQSEGGMQVICYVTPDFAVWDNQDVVYEGRFPEYANETAIGGLLAKQIGKKIGDTIEIIKDKTSAEYLITGLIQGANYMGHDTALTEEGYRHLEPGYRPINISVYLREGENNEAFIQAMQGRYEEKIMAAVDVIKQIEASLGMYRNIVSILAVVILLVTALIILLTLYLVVKTALLHKHREVGIQKAIGFTTRQLIWQTALSFLPTMLLATLLGCAAGWLGVNPLLSLLLSGMGMMKVGFAIPLPMLVLLCVGLVCLSLLVTVCVSSRIRKITPYTLMSE